ncbi:MAG TPA: hypothetical protein ENH31_00285, partial [Nitrospirae bacterium]|nr:hypothetical protein [Nitrospirota bacterium]
MKTFLCLTPYNPKSPGPYTDKDGVKYIKKTRLLYKSATMLGYKGFIDSIFILRLYYPAGNLLYQRGHLAVQT